jgi:Tfp pilus assembly PilM family ATPase
VTWTFSIIKFKSIRPPVRRVLALDAGSRCIKLLLAESGFGHLRILKEELIDLQQEGLVASDEIKAYLQTMLQAWDRPPLALVLPEHLSISQVIDLPLAPESEVEKLIRDETVKLSGVSDSPIVYDFVRTETSAKSRQRFWVTLSQEGEIRERIQRLGVESEDLCEVTTTANALLAAFRESGSTSPRSVLVHMGAQTTVVVVLLAGQGAYATSFQMGGDFFTRALARLRNCSEGKAEALKRAGDLLNGAQAAADFVAIVDGWVAELKRQLNEWFEGKAGESSDVSSFELVASGGAFDQPGLLEYLKTKGGLPFQPWPRVGPPEKVFASKRFEVAYGAALQALGCSTQPVSLLPEDYRRAWRKRQNVQKLEFASLVIALVCVLVLALGTWHNFSLLGTKRALLTKVQAGQEALDANDALSGELIAGYEGLRPVFASQQNTLDTLKTLALLQQSRSNQGFWYVLLADQQTYFNQPPGPASTNRSTRTNLLAPITDRSILGPATFLVPPGLATNLSPAKPGFIAELCVPEEPETARRILGQLVTALKQQPLYSKVDLLSDDLRRSLADSKVVVTDRTFVIALDFAETDFHSPLRPRKSLKGTNPKRSRPVTTPEEDKPVQITP